MRPSNCHFDYPSTIISIVGIISNSFSLLIIINLISGNISHLPHHGELSFLSKNFPMLLCLSLASGSVAFNSCQTLPRRNWFINIHMNSGLIVFSVLAISSYIAVLWLLWIISTAIYSLIWLDDFRSFKIELVIMLLVPIVGMLGYRPRR